MPPKPKARPTANKGAAAVLRCYESEVAGVKDGVVTTIDGQRYELTGSEPGDYVWLRDTAPEAAEAVESE